MRRAIHCIGAVLATMALLAGCGGGSSVTPPARDKGGVRCTIAWPPAAKLVPSAALSIELVLREGAEQIERQVIDRPADGAPSAVTFANLPTGTFNITATAFPQVAAAGTPQATGTIPVVIAAGAEVPVTLTMASTVASWVVTGTPAPLPVGNTFDLVATARDVHDAVVLVPAATWVVTSGTGVVTVISSGSGQSAHLRCDAGGVATVLALSEQQIGSAGSILESAPVTIQSVALPTIEATATPAARKVTQTLTLSAAATVDTALGRVASYDWDLDGNGTWDRTGLTSPTVTTSYATSGVKHPAVRVTDNFGSTATSSVAVTVNAADVPTLALGASSTTPTITDAVTLTATATHDADVTTITGYDWDLDGDGTYETTGRTANTIGKTYATPGVRQVGVRVHDSLGQAATDTLALTVTSSGVVIEVGRRGGRR